VKLLRASPWLLALLLSACAVQPPAPPPTPTPTPVPVPPPARPPEPIHTPAAAYPTLKPVDWAALTLWQDDTVSEAWTAFLRGCATLKKQGAWQAVCNDAAAIATPDDATTRAFFEQRFQLYQATMDDGNAEGLITGYYEPLLKGDRVRTERARFPLYAVPDDLITVDLASVYPELKNLRLRGRLAGNKLVPYATRKKSRQRRMATASKASPSPGPKTRSICSSYKSRAPVVSNCPTARTCASATLTKTVTPINRSASCWSNAAN